MSLSTSSLPRTLYFRPSSSYSLFAKPSIYLPGWVSTSLLCTYNNIFYVNCNHSVKLSWALYFGKTVKNIYPPFCALCTAYCKEPPFCVDLEKIRLKSLLFTYEEARHRPFKFHLPPTFCGLKKKMSWVVGLYLSTETNGLLSNLNSAFLLSPGP